MSWYGMFILFKENPQGLYEKRSFLLYRQFWNIGQGVYLCGEIKFVVVAKANIPQNF